MANEDFERTGRAYDAIARQYREAKKLPIQEHVVRETLLRLVGDVAGQAVLDLGCGEGHNTRLLKQLGAGDVLGVDISSEMIRLALDAEAAEPLGCRYQVADVAGLRLERTFDLVVGAFLLNYAASRSQLLELCRTIERALGPGGRFVGINFNMALDAERYEVCRKYGRWQSTTPDRREGDAITVHLIRPDGGEARFTNFYLSPETYEAAFAEAGLRDFSWEAASVSRAGLEAYPEGYWDALLAAPPIVGMRARKKACRSAADTEP